MASVTYSNAKKYRYLGQDEEVPEQNQKEALRKTIIKELLHKQLSRGGSLQQQQHNRKKFFKASHEECVSVGTSGLTTFEDFKSVESLVNVKQTLKSCGLSNAEVQLLLEEESQSSPLEAPHARRQRLQAIEDKLLKNEDLAKEFHQTTEHCIDGDYSQPSQHQEESEKVLETDEVQEPTSHHDFLPEGHPMNYLKEIAEKLFPTDAPDRNHDEFFGKKRVSSSTEDETKSKRDRKENPSCVYLREKPKSYWDMEQIPKVMKDNVKPLSRPSPPSPGKGITSDKDKIFVHSTKPTCITSDHTKPFIMSLDPDDLIPLQTIQTNRISIEKLKEMEKFKNYNEGTPSRTLFIKNLSSSVSAKDLASLMGHFESNQGPKIMYRILGGRMKGQAFVTFPDEEAASKALKLCTGYLLHDKPLVAAFGKKS